MATVTPKGTAPADAIVALADRFDPDVIDVPRGRARVRLEVAGDRAADALIGGRRLRLREVNESAEPDAVLSADAATWIANPVKARSKLASRVPAPWR